MKFKELGLDAATNDHLESNGYLEPTIIQKQAIPNLLQGMDLYAIAPTGTGKTAAFLIPLLQRLQNTRLRAKLPRILILEPTRELAQQVAEELQKITHRIVKSVVLVGGEWINEQDKRLKNGVDILVATPGRFLDLLERGKLILSDIKALVIDEADRMLDMGFMPDVNQIIENLPAGQRILFSATSQPEIETIANKYLQYPIKITLKKNEANILITQYFVTTSCADKPVILQQLCKKYTPDSAIVFCNRKKDIATLTRFLKNAGFNVMGLHGDLGQQERSRSLDALRNKKINLLIASDVAARGIDISDLSMVINFDVPNQVEDYIHRIGRTGRAGNNGIAITMVDEKQRKTFAQLQQKIKNIESLEIELPSVHGFAGFTPKFFLDYGAYLKEND